jgi:hypothetical protein
MLGLLDELKFGSSREKADPWPGVRFSRAGREAEA